MSAMPTPDEANKTDMNRHCTARRLRYESLEGRRLLATDMPNAISGIVYIDEDSDGVLSAADVRIEGAQVQLLQRTTEVVDGDPINTDVVIDETLTNADGFYCFDDLDPSANYVIRQTRQVVGQRELSEVISRPFSILVQHIDFFESSQVATDFSTIEFGSLPFTSFVSDADEVIGSERDMFATAIEGDVSLASSGGRLSFNVQDGSIGDFMVQWDGTDGDEENGLGLGGVDLAKGSENAGIYLRGVAELPNIGVSVRLYSGGQVISSIRQGLPTVDAGQIFWSFAEGFQTPTDGDAIDAIELLIQPNPTSSPGWIDDIGVITPRVRNIRNTLTADLEITKTDNRSTAVPGTDIQYVITARNNGPEDIAGAKLTDLFTDEFSMVRFESEAFDGATGNTSSGDGDIEDTLDLPVGSSVIYVVAATLTPDSTGEVTNVATISVPDNFTDPDESNNSATDTNALEPEFTINLDSTSRVGALLPGDTVDYEFVVANEGPSVARRVRVTSDVSELIKNVVFTSQADVGASGNTGAGDNGFEDELTLTPGASVTYQIMGELAAGATGDLVVSSVTAATLQSGQNGDIVVAEQTATETSVIQQSGDLAIFQTNDVDILVPGEEAVYTIVAKNNGANDVENVVIENVFAAELTQASYVSAVTAGTVTGNTTAGSGNIVDTVSMSAGSEITYTATVIVAPRATGVVTNVSTVTGPDDLFDENPDDNVAAVTEDVQPLGELSIDSRVVTGLVVPGMPITYEVRVSKTGPSTANGAIVAVELANVISNITYTSEATSGVVGNTSGEGTPADTLQLREESEVIYTVTGLLSPDAIDIVESIATVTAPDDFLEINHDDNLSQTTVTPNPRHDVVVTHTTPTEFATFGGKAAYRIVVRNDGPSRARGVSVLDTFPTTLKDVQYQSTAVNGAIGNADGSGNIAQTLDLPVGASVTYNVTAQIRKLGNTRLNNRATAILQNDQVDPEPANNSAVASIEVSTGLVTRQVVVGDMNGDSFDDAVVVHEYSGSRNDRQGTIGILISDQSGGLQLRNLIRVGDRPQSVAIGDFNKDGRNDLVVARVGYGSSSSGSGSSGSGSSSNSLLVLRNIGRGRYSRSTILADDGPIYVATGDLDNDGDTDIAAANFRSDTVSIIRSHGNGTFAPPINIVAGEQPVGIAIGNFNADNHNDIAVANAGSGTIAIYSGPFYSGEFPSREFNVGRAPSAVIAADIDQDGRDDLAVADYSSDTAFVYYGNGNGSFTPPGRRSRLRLPGRSQPRSLVANDFDGDGTIDIAVAQSAAEGVSMFYGRGERSFAAGQTVMARPGPESVAAIASTLVATSFVRPGGVHLYSDGDNGTIQPVQAPSNRFVMQEVSVEPVMRSPGLLPNPSGVVENSSAIRRAEKPFAVADDSFVATNAEHLFDVTANDWILDKEGSHLRLMPGSRTVGKVAVANGMVQYTAPEGFVGHDVFVYEIADSAGNIGSARVTVDVAAPIWQPATSIDSVTNIVPVGNSSVASGYRPFAFAIHDDRFTVHANEETFQFDVQSNDRAQSKRIWIESQSGPGLATIATDGTLMFHRGGFDAADTTVVIYSVEDESGQIGAARIEITMADE